MPTEYQIISEACSLAQYAIRAKERREGKRRVHAAEFITAAKALVRADPWWGKLAEEILIVVEKYHD